MTDWRPVALQTETNKAYHASNKGATNKFWQVADVEEISSGIGDHVLVDGDSRRLQCLTCELLVLVTDQMTCGRELITRHLLLAHIEDPDLRVRHTSAIASLGVRLVLVVAVALRRTPSHG